MISKSILRHLLFSEEYGRKVMPYLKEEYFQDRADRAVFSIVDSFVQEYGAFPSLEAVAVEVTKRRDLDEYTFDEIKTFLSEAEPEPATKLEWLVDQTEEFCQDQALANAVKRIMDVVDPEDDKRQQLSKGAIPDIMREALAVSFDTRLGHNWANDAEFRYAARHESRRRVKFDVDYFNKVTNGGLLPGTLNVILAGVHVGKAQPLTSRIPTPTGWVTMGDLRVGDRIFGSDGKPIQVTGVFPQGQKDVYRLTFLDGRTAECCQEHLWHVTTGRNKWRTLNLEKIKKIHDRGRAVWVPLAEPVQYPTKKLSLHPYVVGALLGDGYLGPSTVTLASVDDEILQRVATLLPSGFEIRDHRIVRVADVWDENICCKKTWYRRNGRRPVFGDLLKEIGIFGIRSYDKFIPEEYLYSSVEDRMELLRGLMDTDGGVNPNGHAAYCTVSERLCQDVLTLVRSLGGHAKVKTKKLYTGRTAYGIAVRFNPGISPFHLSRKTARVNRIHPLRLAIIKIEKIGKEDCQCISVDATDHLYLTDDFVITHNTFVMGHMAASQYMMGKNVLYITMEMSEEQIGDRIDANLLGIDMDMIDKIPREAFMARVAKVKAKTSGNLEIRQFPTAGASVLHFRHLIDEFKLKNNVVFDVVYIDYLNICASAKIKMGGSVNSYTYVKSIAEEVRGMAVELGVPIVTATQTTRSGSTNQDPGMDDTSESFGLPATADLMLAVVNSPELEAMKQLLFKQLKNRYRNAAIDRKFVVGVDRTQMRLHDVEQHAQRMPKDVDDEEGDAPPKSKLAVGTRGFK